MLTLIFFFFNDPAPTEIYTYLHTLSLHDALPISVRLVVDRRRHFRGRAMWLGIGSGRHLAGSRCQRVETERLRRSELQPGLPGQSRIGDAEERKQRRARGGGAENRAAARNLVHWHDHPVRDSRCPADAKIGSAHV